MLHWSSVDAVVLVLSSEDESSPPQPASAPATSSRASAIVAARRFTSAAVYLRAPTAAPCAGCAHGSPGAWVGSPHPGPERKEPIFMRAFAAAIAVAGLLTAVVAQTGTASPTAQASSFSP